MAVLNQDFRLGVPGAETFTRTGLKTALDFEGILRTYETDEQAIVGTRVVRNTAAGAQDVSAWTGTGGYAGTPTQNLDDSWRVTLGDGEGILVRSDSPTGDLSTKFKEGSDIATSIALKLVGGASTNFQIHDPSGWTSTGLNISAVDSLLNGSTFTTVSSGGVGTLQPGSGSRGVGIWLRNMGTGDITLDIKDAMVVDVSGMANQIIPSFVDGLAHYLTENGNTVSSGVVTEAEGGLLSTRLVGNLAEGTYGIDAFSPYGGASFVDNGSGVFTLSGLGPSVGLSEGLLTGISTNGQSIRVSFDTKADAVGSEGEILSCILKRTSGVLVNAIVSATLTDSYVRYTTDIVTGGADNVGWSIQFYTGSAGPFGAIIKNLMVEDVTGQANQNPSSYIAPGVAKYLGANNNTVAGVTVVEAADGPVESTSQGLLLEGAGTNVLTQSNDLSTSWFEQRVTITADVETAVDGTLTADRVIPTSVNGTHNVFGETVTKAAEALPYTATYHITPDEIDDVELWIGVSNSTAYSKARIDLTGAGSVVLLSNTGFTDAAATVELLDTGIYQCRLSCTTDTSTTVRTSLRLLNSAGESSYIGDDVSGLHVSFAQLEEGAFATSTIETTATAVTRNADSWLLSQDFGVNDITGHLVFRPQFNHDADKGYTPRLLHLVGPSNSEQGLQISVSRYSNSLILADYDESGVATTATTGAGPAYSSGDLINLRFRKSSAGLKIWVDSASSEEAGTQAQADFEATLGNLRLGARRSGSITNPVFATFQHISIATGIDAKSDAELEALTTDFAPFVGNSAGIIGSVFGSNINSNLASLIA